MDGVFREHGLPVPREVTQPEFLKKICKYGQRQLAYTFSECSFPSTAADLAVPTFRDSVRNSKLRFAPSAIAGRMEGELVALWGGTACACVLVAFQAIQDPPVFSRSICLLQGPEQADPALARQTIQTYVIPGNKVTSHKAFANCAAFPPQSRQCSFAFQVFLSNICPKEVIRLVANWTSSWTIRKCTCSDC